MVNTRKGETLGCVPLIWRQGLLLLLPCIFIQLFIFLTDLFCSALAFQVAFAFIANLPFSVMQVSSMFCDQKHSTSRGWLLCLKFGPAWSIVHSIFVFLALLNVLWTTFASFLMEICPVNPWYYLKHSLMIRLSELLYSYKLSFTDSRADFNPQCAS